MPIGSLDTDLRQFFSFSVLTRLERLAEANVAFSFEPEPLYLSCYDEAMKRVESNEFHESDPTLLTYAQVFERFAVLRVPGVSRRSAARLSAALYWLAGYSANAMVIARTLRPGNQHPDSLRSILASVLARSDALQDLLTRRAGKILPSSSELVITPLARYLLTGESGAWDDADTVCRQLTAAAQYQGLSSEYAAGVLLAAVLRRLRVTSLWASAAVHASAPAAAWRRYAAVQVGLQAPLVDLWPSQRAAIGKGLLDGSSSLVLRMPTSAGKTKMTELAFVNDLFTDDRRCLYLAPFRALVGEVEASLGPTLADLGIGVASLYGGAESNEIEVELSKRARVVIATPEKMSAVLRMAGGKISDFGTIILDEGHLLGDSSRGAAYELQLASLRAEVEERREGSIVAPRVVFLSAVLPNAGVIARWLAHSSDALAETAWHPTSLRLGVLTWPAGRTARLEYVEQPGQPKEMEFFVPRVLEEERWSERHPGTGRNRHHVFPDRSDKASIAAALAFRYAAQGPVIVYAQQPAWVESVAERILNRVSLNRAVDTGLVGDHNQEPLDELATYVGRRMGDDSVVARALRVGAGLHHGGVPITIRLAIEEAYRDQVIRLLVATNTVSQGVNFPVKTVILHSLPRGNAPTREFWNLAGRAGRAMRETDGEVVLLLTGGTNPNTIARMLDRRRVEPATSQLLAFVRAVLERYPAVSAEAIEGILAVDAERRDRPWHKVIDAIDTRLLEVMVEDLIEVEQDDIERLVQNLLATAEAEHEIGGAILKVGIEDLIDQRRRRLRRLVPDVAVRRRFSHAGITASSALVLENHAAAMRTFLLGAPEISQANIAEVFRVVCQVPELASEDAERAARAAWAWMARGSYADVLNACRDFLPSLDEAVPYVERTLSYTFPWILNGLLRLLEAGDVDERETDHAEASLPAWARYLPQFLRFGVSESDLVWIMSMGVTDPSFAEWVRGRFVESEGRRPHNFREIVSWMVDRQEGLREAAIGWPRYFVRQLGTVLERYAHLSKVLVVQP